MTRSPSPSAARSPASPEVAEQEHERQLHEPEEDCQRRERPERMDVVGARQLDRTAEGGADPRPLEHEHRHDEADEGEPGHSRKHEEERQKGRRNEDDRADDDGAHHVLPARPHAADDRRGSGVGRGHQRRPRREHQNLDERRRGRPRPG